jgi:hypothetical protein
LPATASIAGDPVQQQAEPPPVRQEAKLPPVQQDVKPPARAAKPELVRLGCQMDSCGFAKLFSVSTVLRSDHGELKAVWASAVSVTAPKDADGMPDFDAVEAPEKFPPPTKVDLVFCSAATPLLITQDETTAELEAFPLAVGNAKPVAGARVSDHLYYWAVCHDKFLTEDQLYSAQTNREAKGLGYLDQESQSIDADSVTFKGLNELYAYLHLN